MIDGHFSITDAEVSITDAGGVLAHTSQDVRHLAHQRSTTRIVPSLALLFLYATGFAAKHKRKCSSNRADIEGLVLLIEDQHGMV